MEIEPPNLSTDVLRLTARMLHAVVREMDLIGCCDDGRFGVLMPRTTRPEALIAAQRVRHSVDLSNSPFHSDPLPFTLQIGVAEIGEGDDPIRLLQRAQAAASENQRLASCSKS